MDYKMDPELLRGYLKDINWQALGSQYDVCNRSSRVRLAASFEGLNPYNALRARQIGEVLASLIRNGSVNPDNLEGEVLDFGMASGAGAYALKQYGGVVTGVDTTTSIDKAVEEGILPRDRVLRTDGFAYSAESGTGSYDFVAAFLMQRDFPFYRLHDEARRVLKPNGQLLVTVGLEGADMLFSQLGRFGTFEEIDRSCGSMDFYAFTHTKE